MEVLKTALFGVPTLRVTGDVDHLSAAALGDYVQEALRADDSHLFVDLAECQYMDSGGVSVLLYAVRDVRGDGWIGVIAPSANLIRIFEITGLSAHPDFRVFASTDEAAAALNDRRADA